VAVEHIREQERALLVAELLDHIAESASAPSPRNLPQLRVLEGIREEVGEGLGQAGVAAGISAMVSNKRV